MSDDDGLMFSKAKQAGKHAWTCKAGNDECTRSKPCRSCLGRRNRRKGQTKQRQARKALGIPDSRYASQLGHEENWRGNVRVEVKAGGRMANPVWTRFLQMEAQSLAAKAQGDSRPFVAMFMPDNTTEGLVVFRVSQMAQVVDALGGYGG